MSVATPPVFLYQSRTKLALAERSQRGSEPPRFELARHDSHQPCRFHSFRAQHRHHKCHHSLVQRVRGASGWHRFRGLSLAHVSGPLAGTCFGASGGHVFRGLRLARVSGPPAGTRFGAAPGTCFGAPPGTCFGATAWPRPSSPQRRLLPRLSHRWPTASRTMATTTLSTTDGHPAPMTRWVIRPRGCIHGQIRQLVPSPPAPMTR